MAERGSARGEKSVSFHRSYNLRHYFHLLHNVFLSLCLSIYLSQCNLNFWMHVMCMWFCVILCVSVCILCVYVSFGLCALQSADCSRSAISVVIGDQPRVIKVDPDSWGHARTHQRIVIKLDPKEDGKRHKQNENTTHGPSTPSTETKQKPGYGHSIGWH